MGMLRDEVAVVGGGLVGKAAALALAQAGLEVRLCGVRPAPPLPEAGRFAQRIYAVNAASRALLQGLRVWEQVPAERIQPVQRMHIRADGAELCFDAYAQRVESLAWIIESDAIERALDLALRFERGVQLSSDTVEHARRDAGGWELGLSGGASLRCALLIGADGRSSRVRAWSSIGLRSKPYGQTAVVCNFSCAAPHGASASQIFTDDGGVLALLPLPALQGRSQVSLVWSAPDALAQSLRELAPQQLAQRVQPYLPQLGVPQLAPLQAGGGIGAWPLVLQRAHELAGDAVALLGDAAHVVHPMAGHGLNLGLQDVQALAAVLRRRAAGEAPGSLPVLRRYARARAEQVLALELATDGLHRLYSPGFKWMAPLRALGLRATDRLPLLKTCLAGYASGQAVLS